MPNMLFDVPVLLTPRRTSELMKFAVLVTAGSFGGLVYAIVVLLEGGKDQSGAWKATRGFSRKLFISGQAVVGIGGAFAALFGTLTLGNAVHPEPNGDFTSSALYFVSLCVIGGFVGNSLLAGVGEKVKRQLTDLKEQTAEAVTTAREAETRAENAETVANEARDLGLMTSIARGLREQLEQLPDKEPIPDQLRSDAEAVLEKLTRFRTKFPVARTLYIPLANLAFALNRSSEALEHLAEIVANRKNANLQQNGDDASIFYNACCYYSLLSRTDLRAKGYGRTDERAESLLAKSLKALETCLEISNQCGMEELQRRLKRIAGDEDLKPLANLEAFKKLIARYTGNQLG